MAQRAAGAARKRANGPSTGRNRIGVNDLRDLRDLARTGPAPPTSGPRRAFELIFLPPDDPARTALETDLNRNLYACGCGAASVTLTAVTGLLGWAVVTGAITFPLPGAWAYAACLGLGVLGATGVKLVVLQLARRRLAGVYRRAGERLEELAR